MYPAYLVVGLLDEKKLTGPGIIHWKNEYDAALSGIAKMVRTLKLIDDEVALPC